MSISKTLLQKPAQTLLLLSSLFLAGCYTHLHDNEILAKTSDRYQISQIVKDITYTADDWPQSMQADLYLPKREDPRPVVLMMHAGGWASRHRDDMDDIGEKVATHGYVVLNISYRFAPVYEHPAQIRDLQQALLWLQNNAELYNLDMERVNTWGYSSGAHLAAMIASIEADSPQLIQTLPALPPIKAVVAGGIPADLRKYHQSPIISRFLGGDNHEMPQRYADASPAYHISADDPPVFLYHGKLDLLVEPEQSIDYYKALIDAGVKAELYLHQWHGHGSLYVFGGSAEDKAIAFLNRYNG